MSGGRWKPGQSGNPKGRAPGTGEVAKLRAHIAERLPEILAKLAEQASGGDVQSARLLLERVLPPLRVVELPVELALPDGGLSEKARQIMSAAASGALAPDQAASLISALAAVARIIESDELAERIKRLEECIPTVAGT